MCANYTKRKIYGDVIFAIEKEFGIENLPNPDDDDMIVH